MLCLESVISSTSSTLASLALWMFVRVSRCDIRSMLYVSGWLPLAVGSPSHADAVGYNYLLGWYHPLAKARYDVYVLIQRIQVHSLFQSTWCVNHRLQASQVMFTVWPSQARLLLGLVGLLYFNGRAKFSFASDSFLRPSRGPCGANLNFFVATLNIFLFPVDVGGQSKYTMNEHCIKQESCMHAWIQIHSMAAYADVHISSLFGAYYCNTYIFFNDHVHNS